MVIQVLKRVTPQIQGQQDGFKSLNRSEFWKTYWIRVRIIPHGNKFKNSPLVSKKLDRLVRPVSSTRSRTEYQKLNRSNAMMMHKGVNLGNNTTISWTLPKMIHSMRPVTQPIRNTNQHTVNNLHAHISSLFCYLLLLLVRGKNPIKCNHTSSEA